MIEDGVAPSSILMFSFTKKAANEIKERLEASLGGVARQVTTSTFHSFCARFLRQHIQALGLENNFTIYDEDDKFSLMNTIAKEANILDFDVKTMSNTVSRYKDNYMTPRQAMEAAVNGNQFEQMNAEFYSMYQRRLMANNAVDFDDLLFYTVYILQHSKTAKAQIHNKYRYYIADENQDSSYIDSLFIQEIVDPRFNNVLLCGDTDQAIYGFRGSSPDNLKTLAQYFHAPVLHLDTNYRSTQTIVNAGKSLIDYNPVLLDEKHPDTVNEKGDKIAKIIYKDQQQEATKTANFIEALVKMSAETEEKIEYKDIAILVRASYLTRTFEDAFLKYHIPYTIVSGYSFYERVEIKDLTSYVKFILNPRDFVSLARIINIPKKRIGEIGQKKIIDYLVQNTAKCATLSVGDIVNLLNTLSNKSKGVFKTGLDIFIKNIRNIYEYTENHMEEPMKIIDKIITAVNYEGYLAKHFQKEKEDKIGNINELKRIASGFISLQDFIESFTLNNDTSEDGLSEEEKAKTNKVKLMTMHGSKGLEFKAVFLPSCNEGVIPHFKSTSQEEIQEERRLMYVAMTRAEKYLYISTTRDVFRFGRYEKANPSRFIDEIDKQYLVEKDFSTIRHGKYNHERAS